jgi:hypothetical protein
MGEPYSAIAWPVNFGSAPFEPPPLDNRGQPGAIRAWPSP